MRECATCSRALACLARGYCKCLLFLCPCCGVSWNIAISSDVFYCKKQVLTNKIISKFNRLLREETRLPRRRYTWSARLSERRLFIPENYDFRVTLCDDCAHIPYRR